MDVTENFSTLYKNPSISSSISKMDFEEFVDINDVEFDQEEISMLCNSVTIVASLEEVDFATSMQASNDNRVLFDNRLYLNLLNLQNVHLNPTCYFNTIQKDIRPYMRKMVTMWMQEVCEDEKCDSLVFSLAVNILDRYLSEQPIKRNTFQLIASVCLFIASKLANVIPILADKLVVYTDNSVAFDSIIEMEGLVLDQLKWNVMSVTPTELVEYMINRLFDNLVLIRTHNSDYLFSLVSRNELLSEEIYIGFISLDILLNQSKKLINLYLIDSLSTTVSPVLIAVACLLSAFEILHSNIEHVILYKTIELEIKCKIDVLKNCKKYIDNLHIESMKRQV
jgi:hypothetical protein